MFRLMTAAILLASAALAPESAYAQGNVVAAYVQNPPVGGNVDAHGCYGSAGYSWSVLKTTCVRMWEAGVRLNPVTPQGSAIMSGFVVFASENDQRRAEIFLPHIRGSLLLAKVGSAPAWNGNGYKLTFHRGVYTLADDHGHALYRGPAA